jgi:hypothetical protein
MNTIEFLIKDYRKQTRHCEEEVSLIFTKKLSEKLGRNVDCKAHIDYGQYVGIGDGDKHYCIDFGVYSKYVRVSKGSKNKDITELEYKRMKNVVLQVVSEVDR